MSPEMGYVQSQNDKCLYIHPVTKHRVGVHVDDLISRGRRSVQEKIYRQLRLKFAIKEPKYVTEQTPVTFLSVQIGLERVNGYLWYTVSQSHDLKQFLDDEHFVNIRPVTAPMPDKKMIGKDTTKVNAEKHKLYRSWIGSLQYFAMWTRYDVAYPLSRLAQSLSAPTEGAFTALLRVIAYMKGSVELGLRGKVRGIGEADVFDMYVDSDHVGDRIYNTRSHTGIIFLLNGVPVHWKSNKQVVTAKSSAEAEIYALSTAVQDMQLLLWRSQEQGIQVKFPGHIYVDNAAGVSFQTKTNPETKLRGCFDLRDAWVKELQDAGLVKAVKVATELNVADLLTKCQAATTQCRLIKLVNDRVLQLAVH